MHALGCLSDGAAEPGYYEDGAFGIRIENLMEVVEATTAVRLSIDYLHQC